MSAPAPRFVLAAAAGQSTKEAARPDPPERVRLSALEQLLALEAELRGAVDLEALAHIIAHESRPVVGSRQTFVLKADSRGRFQIVAASHLSEIERDAPAIRFIEARIAEIAKSGQEWLDAPFALVGEDHAGDAAPIYPFLQALGVLLRDRAGAPLALVVHTRNFPWVERDFLIGRRIGDCAAHAWAALRPRRIVMPKLARWPLYFAAAAMAVFAMLFPVPLTVLAPGRISAVDAFVVAAPLDGVIEEVLVDPNATIAKGVPIARYVDTTLRNKLLLAESEIALAESKSRRAAQASFNNADAKRDLAVAEAELKLKRAERDFAAEMLARSQITAPTAGVAVFADRKEWAGRPVSTGERLLDIADPARVEMTIDLPVEDAIALPANARVRLFLDGDPLKPLAGEVIRIAHEPRLVDNRFLAYAVTARLLDTGAKPRLGLRGAAQLVGAETTLFYFLFRRPIRAVRQWAGL